MKIAPRLASALVALVESGEDMTAACDAALTILQQSSPSEIPTFPHLVARELKKVSLLHVRVTTTNGSSSLDRSVFAGPAKSRHIDLVQLSDESLIGGTIVQADDDRIDHSLSTGLEDLQDRLLSPLSA